MRKLSRRLDILQIGLRISYNAMYKFTGGLVKYHRNCCNSRVLNLSPTLLDV